MPRFHSYKEVREYLYSLRHHGVKYGIDRMILLAEELGHPERKFPSIHIAGTNGKGSTAAMLESIYRTTGLRTGLFTSPHLVHQGERVQVDREILSHEGIVELANRLVPVGEAIAARNPEDRPSFFELMTAMGFLRFADCHVDLAILETGLGGRLDATNVVLPELAIITSVSLDHCDVLGETLAEIAREKAGILKPGRPCVLGVLPEEAETAIREVAQERGCPVHTVYERFGEERAAFPQTRLAGSYQRANAATAALAVELLRARFPVSDAQIEQGLASVQWAGRWDERPLAEGKRVILDAAHNPEGAMALEENLRALVAERGKPVIIAGTLGERRAQHLMPVLARYARELYLVRPSQPRACPAEVLRAALPTGCELSVFDSTVRELFPVAGVCQAGASGSTLVVTGSIYLLGEVLDAIAYGSRVGEAMLQD